jgi:hypothetical protein
MNQGVFDKGTLALNLGVGIGSGFSYGFGSSLKGTPAISISAEKGIVDGIGPGVISVGALLGYQGFRYDYPGNTYKATWTHLVVLARGAYHYNFGLSPKLDTYGGVSVGLRHVSYKDTYYDALSSTFGGTAATAGIFVGGRYFFTNNIGAFAELGYDMSYLKFGLSAKF